jgi:hypothetical protein
LPEVHWEPEASDAAGVTLGGALPGGADGIEAAAVSVTCGTGKIGRGSVATDHASLRLEAADVAVAVQCRGLKVTITRGSQSASAVVPVDLAMKLAPNVNGGIGVSRTTSSPDMVLAIPSSSNAARLTIGRETYVARSVTGGNAEFAVPILALTKAALGGQHAIATTGAAPIEYFPAITIAGKSVGTEAAVEPAPTPH